MESWVARFGLGLHDESDDVDHLLPAALLRGQLLLSCGGDAIVLGALVAFSLLPLGAYPGLAFEAVKRWVEGAGFDLEDFAGARSEGLGDAVAVLRPPLEGLEDEHVQRSLEKFDSVLVCVFACHDVGRLHPYVVDRLWLCRMLNFYGRCMWWRKAA
jgi:hypothetical protein